MVHMHSADMIPKKRQARIGRPVFLYTRRLTRCNECLSACWQMLFRIVDDVRVGQQPECGGVGKRGIDLGENLKKATDLHDAEIHDDGHENRPVKPDIEASHNHGVYDDADQDEPKLGTLVADALSHLLAGELVLHAGIAYAENPIEQDEHEQGDDRDLGREAIPDR